MSDTQAELRAIIERFFSKSMLARSPRKVDALVDEVTAHRDKQIESVLDNLKNRTELWEYPSEELPYDEDTYKHGVNNGLKYALEEIEAERKRLGGQR